MRIALWPSKISSHGAHTHTNQTVPPEHSQGENACRGSAGGALFSRLEIRAVPWRNWHGRVKLGLYFCWKFCIYYNFFLLIVAGNFIVQVPRAGETDRCE
jgi:hypothetical protein